MRHLPQSRREVLTNFGRLGPASLHLERSTDDHTSGKGGAVMSELERWLQEQEQRDRTGY